MEILEVKTRTPYSDTVKENTRKPKEDHRDTIQSEGENDERLKEHILESQWHKEWRSVG